MGINAGNNTTGARNFLAGKATGNATDLSDMVLIGDSVMSSGSVNSTHTPTLAGSTIVGSGAFKSIASEDGIATGSMTALGFNAGNAIVQGEDLVLIGDSVLSKAVGGNGVAVRRCTIIGPQAGANLLGTASSQGPNDLIVIGYSALNNTSNSALSTTASVVIGNGACQDLSQQTPNDFTGNVVIGYHCLIRPLIVGASGSSGVVAIGTGISAAQVGSSVLIGNTVSTSAASICNNSTLIGDNCQPGGTGTQNGNVCIGALQQHKAQVGCIILGTGAGNSTLASANVSHFAVIEDFTDALTLRSAFYADMNTGNVILGNSGASNRDLNGTNSTKLLNGTKTGNPVGGGYFWVSLGALHWVGSSGTDTVIAPA